MDGAYLVEGVAHFERDHLAQEGECMVCSPAVDVVSAADTAARCQWMSVLYVRDTVHVGYAGAGQSPQDLYGRVQRTVARTECTVGRVLTLDGVLDVSGRDLVCT